MPDKKANKNYNISITDKEEIVKESISEITKQFSEKIELVGKQIFENVNKQYQEEIMALKLEITQLKESQDFLSNKYDELKTEFEQLNVINSFFFFSFRPFPLVRGGHSVSSFSTSFCLQCPSPSHQLPSYLLLPHLKIFSLVSLFSSFLVTPFPSSFFLHTLGLSS